ncbi:hypothetical protein BG011_007530 [Mortierella polycephala]|uniref:Uncharacterized protein n=1 Tax=Mortierella polycephala TaxID=41804 RepID=A0A9P6PS53_9FUNG|nr:hypothetical protein BG011_007530 [Mortierella polycephala]
MTATTFMNSLLPPASPIVMFDITYNPIPAGKLSNEDRAQLQNELAQIRQGSAESQQVYNTAHASIPTFQQLVLNTHAQVAAAKQAVLQAKGITSSPSSATSSSATSNASSPPSPSSPFNNQEMLENAEEHEKNVQRLEQEHTELGLKLSQVLKDKAEAEATKKRLNDYMMQAKARIKEIEQKLSE